MGRSTSLWAMYGGSSIYADEHTDEIVTVLEMPKQGMLITWNLYMDIQNMEQFGPNSSDWIWLFEYLSFLFWGGWLFSWWGQWTRLTMYPLVPDRQSGSPLAQTGGVLSQMELQALLGALLGWVLLGMGAWHMCGHAHSLRQMSHQVLHAYLIAHPQHRDHCEPGSACP